MAAKIVAISKLSEIQTVFGGEMLRDALKVRKMVIWMILLFFLRGNDAPSGSAACLEKNKSFIVCGTVFAPVPLLSPMLHLSSVTVSATLISEQPCIQTSKRDGWTAVLRAPANCLSFLLSQRGAVAGGRIDFHLSPA